jgi:4-hydroxybenzoate polyprenyltransferase
MEGEQPKSRTGRLVAIVSALVLLARPGFIPTIASNCLAGWWLSGGGNLRKILFVLGGAALVFLGGALLNDAFDVAYDRKNRPIRPIPSRRFRLRNVWRAGIVLLLSGTIILQWPSRATAGVALVLVLCVILHNLVHRLISFSPVLLGTCRCLLYVLGASAGSFGVTGWSMWGGIAIACYSIGIEVIANAKPGRCPRLWALGLTFAPVVMALLINSGRYMLSASIFGAVFVLWMAWSLRDFVLIPQPATHRRAWLLLPGMVLADMLAACVTGAPLWSAPQEIREMMLVFLGLFGSSVTAGYAERWVERRELPAPSVPRFRVNLQ